MKNSVLQLIGNTPMVKINHLVKSKNIKVYAKLEGFNPTGSVKDRIALFMIKAAIKNGSLTSDKTIIEATSGNTGISIAMVGRLLSFKVIIVMSEGVSIERQKIIKAFGAKIILTPASEGTDGAIKKTNELVSQNPGKFFNLNQFCNKNNVIAHYKTTAEEIWQQTKGKVTHVVCAVGTGGTISGIGAALKKKNPGIKVIEAQPTKVHCIQGLKNMKAEIVPLIYNPKTIDKHIFIKSESAFKMCRQIALKEGIFAGMSSGAAMLAAKQLCGKIKKGCVVVIFADRGEKYLSTKLFNL